jgi:predicted permease
VSPGFFGALRIPILQGRAFDARDRAESPRVAVVSRSFARRYFSDGRSIGRRIAVAGFGQGWATVVGVSGDIRHEGLSTDPAPTVFLLHAQKPGYITTLVARTVGDPGASASTLRRAIQEVDRTQAVSAVKTMEQYVDDAVARPRLYAVLVASFAIMAVTLALLGVYGLLAFVAARRTHEVGIRMALGAGRDAVLRLVLRHAVLPVSVGLVMGLAAAVGLRGLVSTLLFGVGPGDPLTYAAAAVLLLGAATVAAVIPAYRASRLDPITALRCE